MLIFGCCLAEIDLPEVGCELCLLVFATGYVSVRRNDFSPGFEPALWTALGGCNGKFTHFVSPLFVEAHPK